MIFDQQAIDISQCEISILGAGRVARTLARAWYKKGLKIDQVMNQSLASATAAVKFIGTGRPVQQLVPPKTPGSSYRILVIGLPDSNLKTINDEIIQSIQIGQFDLLLHLSGQHGVEVFDESLAAEGIELAATHPLLAFADPLVALKQLQKSFCLLAAGKSTAPLLEALFNSIGMRTIQAPIPLDRPSYHMSMVAASNLICAIQYLSIELAKQAGLNIQDAQSLATNLASNALIGIQQSDPVQALTGPVERGDLKAIDLMLSSLQQLPITHTEAIQGLLKVVVEMAVAKGSLSADQQAQVLKRLELVTA